MNVLMISGDPKVKSEHSLVSRRIALQRGAVDRLEVLYWGRGSLFPRVPEGHFDVVTVQDPFWRGLYALYLARCLRARCNVQVHADLQAQSFLRHILAQIVLRHADSVRVVSEKLKKQVLRYGARGKVEVLPVYVDVARFASLKRIPRMEARKTVLWVGRFEPEKDPLLALSVLQKVRATGLDVSLVMLGDGSLLPAAKAAAKGLPVEFPGWQDSLPFLERADAVLSTSRTESWGASIVEALAAGTPVVAPDLGIAREAGASIAPREDLASGLIQILRQGSNGVLRLQLPSAQEWAARWRNTL